MNCESQSIITWVNFFRSFDFLWENKDHCFCDMNTSCFFCHMRSCCIRLRSRGQKGPRALKPYECLSQLDQFKQMFGVDWRDISGNILTFVNETLKLLNRGNSNIKDHLIPLHLVCNISYIDG